VELAGDSLRDYYRWRRSLGSSAAGASPEGSPHRGRVVTDPEGLSGLWEAPNGHGGFVGIHIVLWTSVAPDATSDHKTLAGAEQQ
jgi:hypothetical protein